ncbi:putative Zn-dependent protease [Aequorivita sublithincola DSM 14238]|uniref:Putative Zn-dependent protease n=1 Tax=Aequorivita sublithincola (strain DSM 14238 / LMG 21431 / ACAM 643 / 9-3) TaxID=746697 RepID=I3YV96_AEQSU|nr:zinc metallopeptidase [Aequorivita sublithincola]AFL80914.1 putative Zn-dependent protease [Aequorivita sublithincola DSM 14238]
MFGYYIIAGLIFLVSWLVSNTLKSKFKKYSQVHLQNGMSGKEIAEKMLADSGITDVKVVSVAGQLTDHYNPADKTVNLSEAVYMQRNAAAAAVAAHECGHAVQHATAYSWLKMRSAIVPAVGIASKLSNFVIMAGLIMTAMNIMGVLGNTIFFIGILLFAATTVFAFITLPVEYDASNRALAWLESSKMVTPQEHEGAKDALKWAARTYVVAAIGSLATLLYFISIFMGRR